MSIIRNMIYVTALAALAPATITSALAQSTDGYHSIQIFPVVVDSASFTQRFTFRNPDAVNPTAIVARFFPGNGASQATSLACPEFTVPAGGQTIFTSLRSLCPELAAGSQFGYLYLTENNAQSRPFAGFSRVSNAAGNGFSVEAFPAHTFTSATAVVTGIRRLTATPTSPSYQTNCFIGNLNDVTPPLVPVTTRIDFTVTNSAGGIVGASFVDLVPGKLTRLLDVFSAVGAPTGDYNDARIEFVESGSDEPGLMTFCTVQDNSSFGADFRIGKQEEGFSTAYSWLGSQDDHVGRITSSYADMKTSAYPDGRPYVIAEGVHSNTHVFYFRHPEWVHCEMRTPGTTLQVPLSYGLEMRLIAPDGVTVIAGGNDVTGFEEVFLGDKDDVNKGANSRYTIEVESASVNNGAARPYGLHCHSGSGHTPGDLVRSDDADRF